jgi:hypothetical protein
VAEPETLGRLVGHVFGAVGAAAAIDAVLTALDPPFLAMGVGEVPPVALLAGGLSSLGFLALGAWIVRQCAPSPAEAGHTSPRRRPDLDRWCRRVRRRATKDAHGRTRR